MSRSDRLHDELSRFRELLDGTAPVRRRQLAEALAALQDASREVEAAEAELMQQNEELIAAREALEIERHRYRDLFDQAPVGYLVSDAAGVISEANIAAAQLLGICQEGPLGKPLAVFMQASERAAFRDLLYDLQHRGDHREAELALRTPDGPGRRAQITVARREDKPGEPLRLHWVLQDVSARRKAEAALHESLERLRHSQRLEAIGRLAGGVAHSFNNLLAALAFRIELILGENASEDERRRHAEEIQKAGERAGILARQLLAFSRKQALQPELLCLATLLRDLSTILHRLLGEDVELRMELDPQTPAVRADLGQIEQVLLNLAANARDAMPEGGSLTIRTLPAPLGEGNPIGLPAGMYTALVVSDTGTGMSAETLSQLFEPFFTTKERGKGTGLGLSTVYGIVRQSGGEVQVESAPGEGATFTVYLPEAAGESPQPERQEAAEPRRLAGSEVILLVEDEENIREPATEILERQGYVVLPAADGHDALEIACSHKGPIHLMITDVVMPRLSGSRLAEKLQPLRPAMRVVYMSGYPEDAISHYGILEPPHRFLQKPFPPGLLLQTVREVLDEEGPKTAAEA